ncbi:MAG: calcium/sodium antiporter [Verrucomicrobia bacterium]|nr:calcium/sodium antiporter [Verrucomicrobiota bacterium]
MIGNVAYIALALALLFVGAECLVKGSASLALRAGLSRLMVGLTIVAFGTSSPELVVSIKAALAHQGDISVGNVVGSNSFNIGVILGLTALVCPISVHRQIIRIDAPIALGVALLPPLVFLNGSLGRLEGLLLVAGMIGYTWMSVTLGRRETNNDQIEVPVPSFSRHWAVDIAYVLIGMGVLVLGSRILVDHSVSLAKMLGVSEALIGLTIVSAGTSMPELATSVVAAIRKHPDIAIGNIIGSNIFNILGVLGLASMVSPMQAPGVSTLDHTVMIGFTVLLIPLLYTGRLLHRLEGATLLGLYGVYLFILWPN